MCNMGNCCADSENSSCDMEREKVAMKASCPSCRATGDLVLEQTLLHQLKNPHQMAIPDEPFYFCAETSCDVVYFSPGETKYRQEHLRQEVGQKSTDPNRTICYCFDITDAAVRNELAESGESRSQTFVMKQVKQKKCSCDILNPSSKCCLTDFPKIK